MTFEEYWETVKGRFPSETSAYFAKDLLRDAYAAGKAAKAEKKAKPVTFKDAVA